MLAMAGLIKATTGGPALFAPAAWATAASRLPATSSGPWLRTPIGRSPSTWRATRPRRANGTRQETRHDPRITRLGHVLRKSSLDELPQFFNILRGEMSCVGPRPVVAEELALYGPHADEYLSTRPGLTGLWQVTGRSSTDFARRVSLDSHYVRTGRWRRI